jgi:GT2 family glycosyltransferase
MVNVAIILLHYGVKKDTYACIESISKLHKNKFLLKLFIVNNDKSKLDTSFIKKMIKETIIIDNSYNAGYAGGINKGIKKAYSSCDYFLILNNDIILEQDCISNLVTVFKEKNVGISGGILTYITKRDTIWFAGGVLNKYFCYTQHRYMNTTLPIKKFRSQSDFINGAVMCISKNTIKEIGYLDEDYFLYWEDVDYCYKALQKGLKSIVINTIVGYHAVSSSTGERGSNKLTPAKAYYFARNPFLFAKKHSLPLFTLFIGQFFIRLPYYITQVTNINGIKFYLNGMVKGISLYLN